MTPITNLLNAARRTDTGFTVDVPADWLQGRTAYGGLSAALGLQAAIELESGLPPLRSAQVAFIGPLSGEVQVSATRLRRGRNATYIQSDLSSEAGLGMRTTWVFMNEMESEAHRDEAERAPVGPPGPDSKIYTGPDDHFIGNFNFHQVQDGTGEAEWLRWVRLRDRTGLSPMVEVMAIGDALPPGAFKLYNKRNVPLSSLNWTVNLLTPEPVTEDGWWLLRAVTDTAHHGFSSQRMSIWNSAGEPVAEGMQAVAIFA